MAGAARPEELPEVQRDPIVQSLLMSLTELERQKAKLLDVYLEEHPEVVKVGSQIAETRKKIAQEAQRVIRSAENDAKSASAQEASLSAGLEAAKAELIDLARRGVEYDSRKREVDAGRAVLDSLMARAKQTGVAQDLKTSNIRIVDPATVPTQPARPRRVLELVIGLVLGLTLGISLGFFLDYMDATIKTPEDVRKHLGAPLLTIVRELEEKGGARPSSLVWDKLASSPFTESYRVLRTALGYSWPEAAPRVLVVTSTVPGEGKTTTAINLAATLATTGSRVLLIDADMRRPQTHAVLKVRRQPGLSDLLVGKVAPEKAIQALGQPNIHYIPSGTPVPSPSDLLSASVLRALLDELRGSYAWIIVDTPPVAPVADTLILAPLSDGTIVVTGAEMTPHEAAAHTLERIRETGSRILGVVLNRAVLPSRSYYGRYYGHYGYGYGYGEDGTSEPKRSSKVTSIRRQSM
jgi:capsular exopolysaccharide synthesis family protein